MIKMYVICHRAESQFTNSYLNWAKARSGEKRIYLYNISGNFHTTEGKTVTPIIANNPFRRKFTPLHMGVNVSFLTLELALP